MYKKSFVHRLTKIFVDVMFYVCILCCIVVPATMPELANFWAYDSEVVFPFTIVIILSGLCSLYMLWQLKSMFKTFVGGDPFSGANVRCLRKCSVAAFVMALIYLAKMIVWPSITAAVIITIFSLFGLFGLTLKDLFAQAIAYKEENDWTV
jgi:uncharacterized membrane protein